MSSPLEFEQRWAVAALRASETAVQSAHEKMRLAAAQFSSGVGSVEQVWLSADLVERELQSQLDVARVLNDDGWAERARSRLAAHSSDWAQLRQVHAQGRLQPAEMVIADLEPVPASHDEDAAQVALQRA